MNEMLCGQLIIGSNVNDRYNAWCKNLSRKKSNIFVANFLDKIRGWKKFKPFPTYY